MRGSILSGDKRGDAVVQMLAHEDRIVHGEAFYNGNKESEIPCVRVLLKAGFSTQKISLDALHLNPETTQLIHENGGEFLIGIKENQSELLAEMKSLIPLETPIAVQEDEPKKGHGRIDQRFYKAMNVNSLGLDKRWSKSGFESLVWVERRSYCCLKKEETREISYYISNQKIEKGNENELFVAVRNHWKIEANNYVRDVSLKEDNLKTKCSKLSKTMACCRTLVVNFLNKEKLKNIRHQLELFVDDFQLLIRWAKQRKFL